MLRLSILTLSYRQAFDDGRMDLMRFLDTCRELSVEGVDLHDSAFPAEDRASLLAVKRACLDALAMWDGKRENAAGSV